MNGYEQADVQGRVLIAQWLREGHTDEEIAGKLRLTPWRLALVTAEIREEIGVSPPPPRGSWGHPIRQCGGRK